MRRTNRNGERTLSRLPSCGTTAYSQYSEFQCGAAQIFDLARNTHIKTLQIFDLVSVDD
mgnify:FL=1